MHGPRGRFLTLIIVPHAGARTWNLRIPVRSMQVAAVLVVAAALFTAVQTVTSRVARMRAAELAAERSRLQADLALKQAQIEAMAARMQAIETYLGRLRELESDVHGLLGNAPRPPGQGAVAPSDGAGTGPAAGDHLALATTGRERFPAPSRGGPRLAPGADGAEIVARLGLLEQESAARLDALAAAAQALEDRLDYLRHRPQGWPVPGPLTSGFGWRRSPFGWSREFHAGIDIGGAWGVPVTATADGTVVYADWKPGLGRTVIIDHGYGFRTLYGHNSRLAVRTGQNVRRGQVIAYMGSSGRSTGPHVHYEVHLWGRPVNPLEYAG
ncbi:M23 family metallopeptidase [Caldinitratiruptor microaerophilus]|uniref:M23ase beta-sheet core domain-containing protein n=1 Tax=Caldinitratiruptor microaerophilus TaxID=671077 RepID=A0AA35G6T8_9FIRM|nr:M23 family metallopeptidase [Caldinitratiruptor microaerophilus]BDG61861.1 hypothetical protein caldi_29510 [Caldinitratiruptor microaerophilus]